MKNLIAQKLAIAIGWLPDQFVNPEQATTECVNIRCDDGKIRTFCLKDKVLMWKLAERFNAFPYKCDDGWTHDYASGMFNTPEEAVIDYIINVGI